MMSNETDDDKPLASTDILDLNEQEPLPEPRSNRRLFIVLSGLCVCLLLVLVVGLMVRSEKIVEVVQTVEVAEVEATRPGPGQLRTAPPSGVAVAYTRPMSSYRSWLGSWAEKHQGDDLVQAWGRAHQGLWRRTLEGVSHDLAHPHIRGVYMEMLTGETEAGRVHGWRGHIAMDRGVTPLWEVLKRRGRSISVGGFDDATAIGERPVIGLLKGMTISWVDNALTGEGVITELPESGDSTWRVSWNPTEPIDRSIAWINRHFPEITMGLPHAEGGMPWLRATILGQAGEYSQKTLPSGQTHEALYLVRDSLTSAGFAPYDPTVIHRAIPDAATVLAVGLDGSTPFPAQGLRMVVPKSVREILNHALTLPSLPTQPTRGTIVASLAPPQAGSSTPWPRWAIDMPYDLVGDAQLTEYFASIGLTIPEPGATTTRTSTSQWVDTVHLRATRSALLITNDPNHAKRWEQGEHRWLEGALAAQAHIPQYEDTALWAIHDPHRWVVAVPSVTDAFTRHVTPEGHRAWGSIKQFLGRQIIDPAESRVSEISLSIGLPDDPHWRLYGTTFSGIATAQAVWQSFLQLTGDWPTMATWVRADPTNHGTHIETIARTMRRMTERLGGIPSPPTGIPMPDDPRAISAVLFEMLTAATRQVESHHWTIDMRPLPVRDAIAEIWQEPNLDYAEVYAIDWSIPATASPTRPFIATRRYRVTDEHPKPSVQVALWDSTVIHLPIRETGFERENHAVSAMYEAGHHSTDIFGPIGGQDHHLIGGGDPDGAWVR